MSTFHSPNINKRRDFLKNLFAAAGIFAMDSMIRPAYAAEPPVGVGQPAFEKEREKRAERQQNAVQIEVYSNCSG